MSQGLYYKISVKLSGNIGVLGGVNIFTATSGMGSVSGGIAGSVFVSSGARFHGLGWSLREIMPTLSGYK